MLFLWMLGWITESVLVRGMDREKQVRTSIGMPIDSNVVWHMEFGILRNI